MDYPAVSPVAPDAGLPLGFLFPASAGQCDRKDGKRTRRRKRLASLGSPKERLSKCCPFPQLHN